MKNFNLSKAVPMLVFLWLPIISVAQSQTTPGQACPVTLPPTEPFVPPSRYSNDPPTGTGWFGSETLWTSVSVRGEWQLPYIKDVGYRQKMLWWGSGFDWRSETEPKLIVTGKRLDGDAPAVAVSDANSAFITTNHPAMMMLVDVPTIGCWQFTGYYKGASVMFVVLVKP